MGTGRELNLIDCLSFKRYAPPVDRVPVLLCLTVRPADVDGADYILNPFGFRICICYFPTFFANERIDAVELYLFSVIVKRPRDSFFDHLSSTVRTGSLHLFSHYASPFLFFVGGFWFPYIKRY